MGVNWTKEQRRVINLRNKNILVSAAAGSGKTAVLVERIITRLTKDENPIDVDELLIVTYTKAAAAEMKERVLLAIEKKLEEEPENVHLQKQATLIHGALITTIDSFCLKVIQEYFHMIDLDPSFRTAEEGELKLLKKDVLDELLEAQYEKKDVAFTAFAERYAVGRDDRKLEELILQIYEFSRSYPNPEKWLDGCVESYGVNDAEELQDTPAGKLAAENIRRYVKDAVSLLQEGIRVCNESDGPYMYKETLEQEMEGWKYLGESAGLWQMFERKQAAEGGRLKPNRDKNVSKELSEYVKSIRKQVKEFLGDITKNYLFQDMEEMQADMQLCRETAAELVFLVKEFGRLFDEKKRGRNLIDFGDMEHLALHILTKEEDGQLVPSEAAKEYQNRFEEVMIDEYQDSNLLQEAILTSVSKASRGEYNIFMVGDVKQSIYRFRLSRPELFMEKFDTYDLVDGEKQRIDLHKNFRSRKEVLDSINFVFRQIMIRDLGGIEYDDKSALYIGAQYKDNPGNDTEIIIVNTDLEDGETEKAEETGRELEARATARRIKQLMENQTVVDKATGEFRKVQYKDIVILTRSLKGWTDVFTKVLNREGIPTYTGSKEGYFETQEIETVLNYLRVLDNPNQDIPLAAVLASDIGGFSGEELAEIRNFNKEFTFYKCVQGYVREGQDEALQRKLAVCFEGIERFREMIPYTAIHELLWKILEETEYGYIASAMPGGEQRSANLEMLLEKAKTFEGTSYKGLFNFVRYIEQLKKYDVDYGEANIADEQADTVRLMSIHKSKGLEFPIVFVAGMSKQFNKQDITREVVIHPELGLGLDAIDLEKRTKAPTFLKKVIQREVKLENIGEELRVLYVAMTRAKEKLILIGSLSGLEKKIQEYERLESREEQKFSFSMLSGANTYFDWVLPCFLRCPGRETYNQVHIIEFPELVQEEVFEELEADYTKEKLLNWDVEQVFSETVQKQIEKQFTYIYPYAVEENIKLKFTVSELKKRQALSEESGELLYKEEDIIPLLPKKLTEKEGLTGASRGTAYHRALELLDFKKNYDEQNLKEDLERFLKAGKISEEMYESIRIQDILQFLNTDIAGRMQNAALKDLLHTEQPFVLGVDAADIYFGDESGEMLLIQGIIDVWFEEEGEIIVLDYKTDKARSMKSLKDKYAGQLGYYAMALERLTGKRVKEKIIYSFSLGKGTEC